LLVYYSINFSRGGDMNNADAPAMPISVSSSIDGNMCSSDFEYGEGLTKREHFAGLAMQGLVSHYGADGASDCSVLACKYADALLKELDGDV
jgi:hypothetical protein